MLSIPSLRWLRFSLNLTGLKGQSVHFPRAKLSIIQIPLPPVHHRALAAIQECAREVIEGALAALLFAAVAFQARLGVVGAPGTDVEALTAGTLEGTIFPAQRTDVGLKRFGVEEVVELRHNRHG